MSVINTEQQSCNNTSPVKVIFKNSSSLPMMSLLFWYLTTVISTFQKNQFIRLLFSGFSSLLPDGQGARLRSGVCARAGWGGQPMNSPDPADHDGDTTRVIDGLRVEWSLARFFFLSILLFPVLDVTNFQYISTK